MKVTLDTNILPADEIIRHAGDDYVFASVSVTAREVEGTSFEVHLEPLYPLAETAVFDESRWDEAAFSDDDALERVLNIVSNGSFPKAGFRYSLTDRQTNQLRDAMIFATHVRDGRDIFVTVDSKAFIDHGRRECLEAEFATKIMTLDEFRTSLDAI